MFHFNAPRLSQPQSRLRYSTRNFLLALLSACALALSPGGACAQQGTLTDDGVYPPQQGAPSKDKVVTQSSNSQTLQVQGPNTKAGVATAYIKFRLTGGAPNQIGDLPPGTPGSHVGKATLRLYVNEVTTPGAFDVYGVTSSWNEGSITTAPQLEAVPVASGVQVTTANSYITVDVTPLVQKWLDYDPNNPGAGGMPNHGLALVSSAAALTTAVSFDSKESTETSHQAQLGVVLKHVAEADQAARADHADQANSANYATTANALAASATVDASQLRNTVATANGGTGLAVSGAAGNFLRSDGSRWVSAPLQASDLPGGSGNYIQNATAQQSGNFNISGNGVVGGSLTAGSVNTSGQYNINGTRMLSAIGPGNTFAGALAGASNTTGYSNTFFGQQAGAANQGHAFNSFFGYRAGITSTANSGSFFGWQAGSSNTTGEGNAFFGASAGTYNTEGYRNAFFGAGAGQNNTTGNLNIFAGYQAGLSNTSESNNTFVGASSNGAAGVSNATAIGANAKVTQSNSVVLGNNANVGIGISAPQSRLQVNGTSWFTGDSTPLPSAAGKGVAVGYLPTDFGGVGYLYSYDYATLSPRDLVLNHPGGNVGIGTSAPQAKLHVESDGNKGVYGFSKTGAGVYGKSQSGIGIEGEGSQYAGLFHGNVHVTGVITANNVSNPSDIRLKQGVHSLRYGLREVMQLRPVSWTWKDKADGQRHLGLIAQEVGGVVPELVLRGTDPAATLSLNYVGLVPVVIKAIQEQQASLESKDAEITALKAANAALNARLAALEQMMRQFKPEPGRP
jgi:hypothetical protein